jgi:pyridoxal phosphate enzyme (YggS family)
MDLASLKQVIEYIKDGNNFGEQITLVGATKTMPVEDINLAIENGLKVVAENKVQEFREKTQGIVGARQQFIGHLQTNKVKYLVGKVELIQSVDSIKLGKTISDECIKRGVTQDILVEINIGGELSKSGFNPDNAVSAVNELSNLPNVKVKGLMAMLPNSQDQDYLSSLCDKARSLYDELKEKGLPFKYLSMGMSNDYLLTIKHGSNMIRLGRDIFGQRNYNQQ